MTSPLLDLLRHRIRTEGSAPLVTWYQLDRGERTELSAISLGNWVDKTSNLIIDEFMLDPGAEVSLELALSDPGHWMTLVWELACWQVGLTTSIPSAESRAASDTAELRVIGPAAAQTTEVGNTPTIACSLHPLGLAFSTPLPPEVGDYALEVRSQPDAFIAGPVDPDSLAWSDPQRRVSHRDLVDHDGLLPGRLLIRPGDPWNTVRQAIVRPLVAGGSSVIVAGGRSDELDQLSANERVLGPAPW